MARENLPDGYPYTAGVFPYRRAGEDPNSVRSPGRRAQQDQLHLLDEGLQ